jgi:hypothetical protein
MKTKKKEVKLILKKQTIANLKNPEMVIIKGGTDPNPNTWDSIPPNCTLPNSCKIC